jgi:hypothetical protein
MSKMDAPAEITPAEVAGRNAREIRREAGAQLQDVARAARRYGLPWSPTSVTDFENGRTALALPTLLVVVAALNDITGARIGLDALFASPISMVQLNDKLTVPLQAVRLALGASPPRFAQLTVDFVEGDMRVCKRLGVDDATGGALMVQLWGRTYRDERDRRAGPNANAQHRGQVARKLQAELETALARNGEAEDG